MDITRLNSIDEDVSLGHFEKRTRPGDSFMSEASGDEQVEKEPPFKHIKTFREIHLKNVAIKLVLLNAKDQLFRQDDIIGNTSTFNECRLTIVH